MNFGSPIIIIFVLMFGAGIVGVVLTRKLTRYMGSYSWAVRRRAFLLLAIVQGYGVWKTVTSDHHFNLHDFVFFGLLLIVFIELDRANYLLWKDWQKFPMLRKYQAGTSSELK